MITTQHWLNQVKKERKRKQLVNERKEIMPKSEIQWTGDSARFVCQQQINSTGQKCGAFIETCPQAFPGWKKCAEAQGWWITGSNWAMCPDHAGRQEARGAEWWDTLECDCRLLRPEAQQNNPMLPPPPGVEHVREPAPKFQAVRARSAGSSGLSDENLDCLKEYINARLAVLNSDMEGKVVFAEQRCVVVHDRLIEVEKKIEALHEKLKGLTEALERRFQ